MVNYHSENISEMINLNNVIQYKYDINKTLTGIKNVFSKFNQHFFFHNNV